MSANRDYSPIVYDAMFAKGKAAHLNGQAPHAPTAFQYEYAAECWFDGYNSIRVLELPFSEVCMHMKVAGKLMYGELVGEWMVQLYDEVGRKFSFPITRGEAGWDTQA